MDQFLALTVSGLVTAALFAVAASGLVLTYTTSGIFNFAHGAMGMFAAFAYWQLRVEWGWPAPVALVVVLCRPGAARRGRSSNGWSSGACENVTEVTKLVVSIAVLFGFFQGAQILWPPGEGRPLPGFFQGNSIDLGFINLDVARRLHPRGRDRRGHRPAVPAVRQPRPASPCGRSSTTARSPSSTVAGRPWRRCWPGRSARRWPRWPASCWPAARAASRTSS